MRRINREYCQYYFSEFHEVKYFVDHNLFAYYFSLKILCDFKMYK